MKSLRINYSSVYELLQIFMDHPQEVDETGSLAANAQKRVDDLTMELKVLTAEIVDDITSKRKVPESARQEVRRSEVPLDIRWQKKSRELNKAVRDASVLTSRSYGLFIRGKLLETIGKIELRRTFGYPTVREDDIDLENLSEKLDIPEE